MNIISLLILETTETLHPDATKILELTSLKSGPDFEIQERLRAEAEKQAVQFDSQKPMIDDGWMKHDETISCYINLQS